MSDRREIKLTKGKVAIVDAEDYEYLNQWSWHLGMNGNYAVRGRLKGESGPQTICMHRVINQTPKGMETDHINHDPLDNRKCNLRSATKRQNGQNKIMAQGKSHFRGVCRRKTRNDWIVLAGKRGGYNYKGSSKCELVAACMYDKYVSQNYGDFASLNFPALTGVA